MFKYGHLPYLLSSSLRASRTPRESPRPPLVENSLEFGLSPTNCYLVPARLMLRFFQTACWKSTLDFGFATACRAQPADIVICKPVIWRYTFHLSVWQTNSREFVVMSRATGQALLPLRPLPSV